MRAGAAPKEPPLTLPPVFSYGLTSVVIEVERPADLLVGSSALSLPSNDPHGLHEGDSSRAGLSVSRVGFVPSAFMT